MRRLRRPYTIVAFIAVVAAIIVVLVPRDLDSRALGGALVLATLTLGLWRGIWPAWLVLTVFTIGDLLLLATEPDWWGVVANGVLLVLLLAPPTRRYARRWRPRALSWLG